MMKGRVISNISIQLIDGQNIQQSNLSVLLRMMIFGRGDLLTYYSLELFSLIMSLLAQSIAPSLRGRRGTGLWLGAWVGLEIQ